MWKILVFGVLFFNVPSFAAKFANQFVEFELPASWQCNLEGAEWVCQNQDISKRRDAIIVLAAKLKGDQDSLDQYLTYLKAAKTFTSAQGKPVKSDSKYAKTTKINEHAWVDALHFESEIPGFYTRYLATVKDDIGVLVTYSIQQNKYKEYLPPFEAMVQTLKVFRRAGGINTAPANSNLFNAAQQQAPTNISENTVFPTVNPQGGSDTQTSGSSQKQNAGGDLFIPILIIGAAIGFLLWRRHQSKNTKY